jgi:hypothetical protein
MTKKVSLGLVFFMFLGFCLVVSYARAQEPKSQLYIVWDVVVTPDKFMAYEAASVKMFQFFAKHEFPWGWNAYRTEDFHYYYLTPIENMAELDKFFEYVVKVRQKAGPEDMAMMEGAIGTYESETMGVFMLRSDLSYVPDNPRVATEDMKFFDYSYYYLRPGMEMEAEKLAADWQAFFKRKGINDGFNVFTSLIWSDLPVWVVTSGAKSEEDFYANQAKMAAGLGDDYMALAKRNMDGCRKYERRTGVFVPELSYIPQKK